MYGSSNACDPLIFDQIQASKYLAINQIELLCMQCKSLFQMGLWYQRLFNALYICFNPFYKRLGIFVKNQVQEAKQGYSGDKCCFHCELVNDLGWLAIVLFSYYISILIVFKLDICFNPIEIYMFRYFKNLTYGLYVYADKNYQET